MSDHTYGTTLTTQYEYDNWGNLVNTISPEGVNTDITRGWSSGSGYYEQVETDGAPSVITHYDSYGRMIHEGSVGPDGISLNTAWSYNSKGLVTSEIKTTGNLQETHTYSYDGLGRMVGEVLPTGQTYTYSYGNRSKTSVTAGRTYTSTFDAWGNTKSSEDPVSSVNYVYYSNGQPKEIESDGDTWSLEYDEAGNRTLLDDPDAGETEYLYDALGRLIEQEDARGYVTINSYDNKGRLASTETDGAVTTYTYGTSGNSKMRLIKVQHANGFISYSYDTVGRVTSKVRNLTGTGAYSSTAYSYNNLNQLVSRTCNGQIERYYYDSNGYKYCSTINGQNVWQLQEYNGIRSVASLGDSLTSISERNLFGVNHLAVIHGNDTISNFRYEYSNATGNVTSRTGMLSTKESFGYDSVDRMASYRSSPNTPLQLFQYSDKGNIISKPGLGLYSYSTVHPHAVIRVSQTPTVYGTSSLTTSYNAFSKIESIRQGATRYSLTYGPDRERWKTAYLNGTRSRTILYGDDYERITVGDTVRHFYYLDGGAIYLIESGQPDRLLFTCTDNLGSIVKVVNKSGTPVFKATYDAWGYQSVTKNQIGFHRGYTGHEMLPDFCLINMNGRMYDPAIGRFLSPDNYIQLDGFSQSYNRYSYCLNNPLKYSDPSGELAWFVPVIAGAIIGAYTGASIQSGTAVFWNWSSNAWKGAIVGGTIGATIGYSISSALASRGANSLITGLLTKENVITKAAGITSSILHSGTVNIAMNTFSGNGIDGAWKAGIVGLATGAWAITGGFGMVKGFGAMSRLGKLAGKLGYQTIGTVSQSIGNNWASNKGIFSRVTLGLGPINFTLGKGKRLLQWENNLGNIAINAFGFVNTVAGGKIHFNTDNLTFEYTGGLMDIFKPYPEYCAGFSPHTVTGNSGLSVVLPHELHHLWHSRALNDLFLLNYGLQGLNALLLKGNFVNERNYYEEFVNHYPWWNTEPVWE